MKTVCLNMIVKDERNVIKRCLSSVRDLIDYWVIVDTGSTDGTQQIIRDFLRDIPGELHERSWVNFEHNRNCALELARRRADYILFIDADEILVCSDRLDKDRLEKSFYVILSKGKDTQHYRINLIDNDEGWRWKGVLHEAVIHTQDRVGEILEGVYIDFSSNDGNRFRDPKKFFNDALVLEKALQDDPTNSRYVFYLAQSYFNAREFSLALLNFEKRLTMPGESEETFFAQFCVGYLQEHLKSNDETVIASYLKSFELNPVRAEPLERLGQFFYQKGWTILSYLLARYALAMPHSLSLNSHRLHWVYDYSLQLLLADSAFSLGRLDEADRAYREVFACASLPEHLQKHVQRRLICTEMSSKPSSRASS